MLYSWIFNSETEIVTITIIGVSLLLVLVIVVLLLVFVNRKNTLVQEKQQAKEDFETELAESQIESRENTLRNISWELHDNIGQLLTLAKIQAQSVKENPERIDEVVETIGTGLNELRALSKLINPEILKNLSITEAVQMELDRFNRLGVIKGSLKSIGDAQSINAEYEIILFRILQEFFSNTIKHAKATELNVEIVFNSFIKITAHDNGVGFTEDGNHDGIGLQNMKNRAKIIGAILNIHSKKDAGTTLVIEYYPSK
jgi:two-component system NarL family sensor kinase